MSITVLPEIFFYTLFISSGIVYSKLESNWKRRKVFGVITIALVIISILASTPAYGKDDFYDVRIVEVYVFSDPGCEYIVIENWGEKVNLQGWTLSNRRATVYLAEIVLDRGERLVIAEEVEGYMEVWQDTPDHIWGQDGLKRDGYFRLVDSGDDIMLRRDGILMDVFCYGDGEENVEGWTGPRFQGMTRGHYAKRRSQNTGTADDWTWVRRWRLGQSNFTVDRFDIHGGATLFVSPDNSYEVLMGYLDGVDRNLVVGVYMLTDTVIARRIGNLSKDGIDVKVLVEGSPVGGISEMGRNALGILSEAGVQVDLLRGGHYSPYNFFHSKYMVADNRSVLVSSENLGHLGYPEGGNFGNRGWGVVVNDESLAMYLTDKYTWDSYYSNPYVFDHHVSYDTFRSNTPTYRPVHEAREVHCSFTVTPVLSPDTSMDRETILGMIKDSQHTIMVQQMYAYEWGDDENPYLEALINAAKRGVEVKILLDSSWYNLGGGRTDNDFTVDRLNNISNYLNIPLEAKLLDSSTGLDKIHNKGMVVDHGTVLISSINWNSNSVLQNREVGLILEGKVIGTYYADIFMHDWDGGLTTPISDAGRDREVRVGEIVRFNGSFSWCNRELVSYRWDLTGDGIFETEGIEVSTLYRKAGVYTVRLRVEDDLGRVDTSTAEITVIERSDSILSVSEDGGGKPLLALVLLSVPIMSVFFIYKKKRKG